MPNGKLLFYNNNIYYPTNTLQPIPKENATIHYLKSTLSVNFNDTMTFGKGSYYAPATSLFSFMDNSMIPLYFCITDVSFTGNASTDRTSSNISGLIGAIIEKNIHGLTVETNLTNFSTYDTEGQINGTIPYPSISCVYNDMMIVYKEIYSSTKCICQPYTPELFLLIKRSNHNASWTINITTKFTIFICYTTVA